MDPAARKAIALIFLIVGTLVLLATALGPMPSDGRWLMMSVGILMWLVAVLAWCRPSTQPKPDLLPDMLATIVPKAHILQGGRAHFFITGFELDAAARILVLAQNQFDEAGTIEFRAAPVHRMGIDATIPVLNVRIEGGALIAATLDLPVSRTSADCAVNLDIYAFGTADGKQVRFGGGAHLREATSPAMQVTSLVVGVLSPISPGITGGSRLCIPISAGASETALPPMGAWQVASLWTPWNRRSTAEIVKMLREREVPASPQAFVYVGEAFDW